MEDPSFESLDIASRIAELWRQIGIWRQGAVMGRARPRLRDAIAVRLKDSTIVETLEPDAPDR